MILNKNNILHYGENGLKLLPGHGLFHVRSFSDADYWYVSFFKGHTLKEIQHNLPIDMLNNIRSGNVTLVLHNNCEAFHDVVEYIYLYLVRELNIPAQYILLISESASINEEVKIVAKSYGFPEIRTEWCRTFECGMHDHTVTTKPLQTLEYKNYTKKFLNLNRRWRIHRPLFVALLKVHDLLEQGNVSLAMIDEHSSWENVWDNLIHHEPSLIPYKDIVTSIPDLYLDTQDLHINQVQLTSKTNQYYENTYFSIVSETNFYLESGSGIFLSEKVFKPVSNKHPFLVLSRPHTLQKFNEIGYRSFGDIIDESYDNEFDDRKRMLMVLEETKRLCNLSDTELKNFLDIAREITTHNYNVLKNKNSFITKL